jgi:hypothetical protein
MDSPLSENGRELAVLLDRLVDAWPTLVQDPVLIRHSMGVWSRAARSPGRSWHPRQVRRPDPGSPPRPGGRAATPGTAAPVLGYKPGVSPPIRAAQRADQGADQGAADP